MSRVLQRPSQSRGRVQESIHFEKAKKDVDHAFGLAKVQAVALDINCPGVMPIASSNVCAMPAQVTCTASSHLTLLIGIHCSDRMAFNLQNVVALFVLCRVPLTARTEELNIAVGIVCLACACPLSILKRFQQQS